MVQMKVQVKGLDLDSIAGELGQQVGALKYRTLVNMAESIAKASPVDSGNYARNHEVGLRSGSFKPDGIRPNEHSRVSRDGVAQYPNAREEGLQGMLDDINGFGLLNKAGGIRSLADPQLSTFVFRNRMTYAKYVEQRDAVYAQTRNLVKIALDDALNQVRSRK